MPKDPLFISAYERRRRIEELLKLHDMTWYALAKKMGKTQTSVAQAFKVQPNDVRRRLSVDMIHRCARALGVSAGFLMDRKEVDYD